MCKPRFCPAVRQSPGPFSLASLESLTPLLVSGRMLFLPPLTASPADADSPPGSVVADPPHVPAGRSRMVLYTQR